MPVSKKQVAPNLILQGTVYHMRMWHKGREIWRTLRTRSLTIARRRLAIERARILTGGVLVDEAAVPLDDLIERFRDERVADLKQSTQRSYRERLAEFVRWAGDNGLSDAGDVTTDLLVAYRRARAKKTSAVTADSDMRPVRAAFSYAHRLGWIQANPFDRMPRPPRRAKVEKRILTMGEIERVIAAARGPLQSIVRIAAFSGLRRGELLNLRWKDVDRERGFIHVVNRPPHFTVKTCETRSVPLAAHLREHLPKPRRGRVYPETRRGDVVSARVQRVFKKAKIGGSLHLFRHSWLTYLLLCGYPLAQVMAWAGHSQITTTQGYLHVRQQVAKKDVEAFRQAFGV